MSVTTTSNAATLNNSMESYCKFCGAYIPVESDVCLACGKPRKQHIDDEGDYLFFRGEKIPVYIENIETQLIDVAIGGRMKDGTICPRVLKYLRKFSAAELKPKIAKFEINE